jgi:hypothetical protein
MQADDDRCSWLPPLLWFWVVRYFFCRPGAAIWTRSGRGLRRFRKAIETQGCTFGKNYQRVCAAAGANRSRNRVMAANLMLAICKGA